MSITKITSFTNDKIKYMQKLRKKRFRDSEKCFIIEGYREIRRALASQKIQFQQIFISPDCFLGSNENQLIHQIDRPTFQLPRRLFEKISYRDRPDGLIALCTTPDFTLSDQNHLSGDFFLIIEGVEKPGNLGTILRTAEGAGVDAVLVADPRIDLFNPNIIRASTGTLFTLPVYQANLTTCLHFCQKQDIHLYAVTPEAQQSYFQYRYLTKTALLFGSEQYGLSESAKEAANTTISLPMKGHADSLNLAMSCGILMYEVVRQRALAS